MEGDLKKIYISWRLTSREKNSCKEIPGKKKYSSTENKNLSWYIMLEKNSSQLYVRKKHPIIIGLGKNNYSYTNKITHTCTPLKDHMVAPLTHSPKENLPKNAF